MNNNRMKGGISCDSRSYAIILVIYYQVIFIPLYNIVASVLLSSLLLCYMFILGTSLGQDPNTAGGIDWVVLKYSKSNGYLSTNANNPTVRFEDTPQNDGGLACDSDTSGAVYVGGYSAGPLNNTAKTSTDKDSVVIKFDANMNRVWGYQVDISQTQGHDFVTKVIIYGSTVFAFGNTYRSNGGYNAYFFGLNVNTGALVFPTVYYGGTGYPLQMTLLNAAIDVNGNFIIVGVFGNGGYTGSLPQGTNATAGTVPAVSSIGYYSTGFYAGFDPNGVIRYQGGVGGNVGYYNNLWAVTTDVTGAVYVGGFTEGPTGGAAYNPVTSGNALPVAQKMDVNGNILWTMIFSRTDSNMFRSVVTDNIGGVYWLMSNTNCYAAGNSQHNFQSDYQCYYTYQQAYLAKSDTNGAFQYNNPINFGIVQAMTIDNTGLLTISGDFNGGNTNSLNGAYPTNNNVYNGFINQVYLSYNCSCGNLASLVSQMSALLNITTY